MATPAVCPRGLGDAGRELVGGLLKISSHFKLTTAGFPNPFHIENQPFVSIPVSLTSWRGARFCAEMTASVIQQSLSSP
jgi:hypothetical protein